MFVRLSAEQFKSAAGLFAGLNYQLAVPATLAGNNPGALFADQVEQPTSAYIYTVEGTFLAGDPHNAGFNAGLRQLLAERLFIYPGARWWVGIAAAEWEPVLSEIAGGRRMQPVARRHYVCRQVQFNWRAHLEPRFHLRRIDADLLAEPGLSIPEHIPQWIEGNWGSREAFFQHGLGFCLTAASQVVSWCVADCYLGSEIEIGIQTVPDYRRRGLAACVTAATVEHAFTVGFNRVGWHCNEDNTGSYKTAERVGFELERPYTQYLSVADPTN